MARLDRQQNELTSIREDIGVNMAAVLHTGERSENTREEVRLTREQDSSSTAKVQFDLEKTVSLLHRRLIALEEQIGESSARERGLGFRLDRHD